MPAPRRRRSTRGSRGRAGKAQEALTPRRPSFVQRGTARRGRRRRQVEEASPRGGGAVPPCSSLRTPHQRCPPRPAQRGALVKSWPAEDGHHGVDEEVAEASRVHRAVAVVAGAGCSAVCELRGLALDRCSLETLIRVRSSYCAEMLSQPHRQQHKMPKTNHRTRRFARRFLGFGTSVLFRCRTPRASAVTY